MNKKSSGCGCSTVVLAWFLGFALLRVCGVTDASWWYSIAPVWWPVWILVKFVGLVIVLFIMVVFVVAAINFVAGRVHSSRDVKVEYRTERKSVDRGSVIDVECEEVSEK